MPSIFISYRRSDSHADAGRIYDRLAAHFGKGSVFKDVDDIPPGVDFRDYLNRTLNQCSVVLAVIGPTWLTATDDQGHRRLKNPADWVRVEIEEALEREGVLVIPLLVSHAAMPRPDDLPNSLQNLAFRNYREARPDPDFHKDMDRLIEGLSRYFRQAKLSPASTEFLLHRPNHFRHRLPSNQTAITRQKFLRWAGMGGASLLSLAGISQVWRRVVSPGSSDTSGWGTPSQTNDASGWGASPQTDTAGGWGGTPTTNDETVPWAGDFGPLAAFLDAGQWQEADQETFKIILETAQRESRSLLIWHGDLQVFPCDTLQKIDELWVNASDGKFGFSVQKNIYEEVCGGSINNENDSTSFRCFLEKVGWQKVWETSLSDLQVSYSIDSPPGHLPWQTFCGDNYCDGSMDELSLISLLFSRLASCGL